MAVLKNRAKMSTSTTGTGSPITLGSAESGYQSFADAGVANADVVRYVIEDGSNFEIGTGTYTATGTTLTRTVSESSNSNNAINLSGSATVFIGATAADIELSGNMAGDISSNGHEIKFADSGAADQDRLTFGASDDLQIYHDGSNSYIVEGGTGDLRLQAESLAIQNTFGQYMLEAVNGGGVNLYHNTTLKAQTQSDGFAVRGQLVVRDSGGGVEYRLPAADGTNGQVLTTDGSGAVTFADAGGGGTSLLSTSTVSSSVSQVDITLAGSHDIYMVQISDLTSSLNSSSNGILRLRVSDDNGSTFESTNTQYITAGREVYAGDNAGTGARGAGWFVTTENQYEGSYIPLSYIGSVSPSSSAFEVYNGFFYIYAANNASAQFNVVGNMSATGSNVVNHVRLSGMFQENQAITNIRIYPESGTLDAGKIRLFSVG